MNKFNPALMVHLSKLKADKNNKTPLRKSRECYYHFLKKISFQIIIDL